MKKKCAKEALRYIKNNTIIGLGGGSTISYLISFIKEAGLNIEVCLLYTSCKHTPETVIEVLLFAIARQLIVEHMTIFQNLIGVIAIAGLFATRKYLFYNFDEVDKTIYRGSERVKRINFLEHIDIPYENKEDNLEDITLREVETRELELGIGVCLYYPGFALRVAQIKNNVITRVEVIRSTKKK